jgi:phage gp36-like protein
MLYCSQADIENEFSTEELARLTGDSSGSTIDNDRIDLAIATSSAIIDAYLRRRIDDSSITAESTVLNRIAVTLSISTLYEIEYKAMMIPESILIRKTNALNLLRMITEGILLLNGATENTYIITNKTIEDKIFNKELLDTYME